MTALVLLVLTQTCSPGQLVGAETAGHCCWPEQMWSVARARCVGVPACPEGSAPSGETCVSSCPRGQESSGETAGHCCWPGQMWSAVQNRCRGIPTCGEDLVVEGEQCVSPRRAPLIIPVTEEPEPPPPPPAIAPAQVEPPRRLQINNRPAESTENPPRRSVFNVALYTAFDFSELTQGATLGFEINFLRVSRATIGLSSGVGVLGCVVASCSKLFLHFPTALKAAVRFGPVELTVRGGLAPAVIWRNGSSSFLAKALIGLGVFIETGRGGVWFGIDFLPNAGVAHVISLGYQL